MCAKHRAKLLLTFQLLIIAIPFNAIPATVSLQWDPSTSADLAGYRVHYQADSSAVPFVGSGAAEGSTPLDVGNTTTATVSGLAPENSFFFAVTAYDSTGAESVYSNILVLPESIPPNVVITSPPMDANISGIVNVSVSASDNAAVKYVQFYVNDLLQENDTEEPYVLAWDTTALSDGSYRVLAKAVDEAGNVGEALSSVTVTNSDTLPPTVSLAGPVQNAVVNGNVHLQANASDNVAVTKVEVYDGLEMIFAGNQNSCSFDWNSALAYNGPHTISAKAYDAAGNMGMSYALDVTVLNDFLQPSVALLSPANGSVVRGELNVVAEANDDTGITLVEFYLNNALSGSDSTVPYSFTWNTLLSPNGSQTITAKAYDAAGKTGISQLPVLVDNTDTTAPVITYFSPPGGSKVAGTAIISASATDDVAVREFELYIDSVLRFSTFSDDFAWTWDLRSYQKGVHLIEVKAYDEANNVSSMKVSVIKQK